MTTNELTPRQVRERDAWEAEKATQASGETGESGTPTKSGSSSESWTAPTVVAITGSGPGELPDDSTPTVVAGTPRRVGTARDYYRRLAGWPALRGR